MQSAIEFLLHVPKISEGPSAVTRKKAFSVAAPSLWNSIHVEIHNIFVLTGLPSLINGFLPCIRVLVLLIGMYFLCFELFLMILHVNQLETMV